MKADQPDLPVSAFDFDLPEDLIALRPVRPRRSARMLHAEGGVLADRTMADLPGVLRPGDMLVFNDTRVLPVQLSGTRVRDANSVAVDATLIERLDAGRWRAFAKPGRRLRPGDCIGFAAGLSAQVEAKREDGTLDLVFDVDGPALDAAIARIGSMPLPPYIAQRRPTDARDVEDYQTLFARHDGAVAAPTAALHFDSELLDALRVAKVDIATVTLHVGAGTFLPVKAETTHGHRMHSETGEIDAATADRINAAKAAGGRVIAVGTTSLRVLETATGTDGLLRPWQGATDIFITPGYRFRQIDGLVTNFHLPRSTLIMLVSALMGLEEAQALYSHAISEGYRFYSYGDGSLLISSSGVPCTP